MTDPWPDVEMIKPKELARVAKIGERTLYEIIRRGEVKATRIGHQWRIVKSDALRVIGMKVES